METIYRVAYRDFKTEKEAAVFEAQYKAAQKAKEKLSAYQFNPKTKSGHCPIDKLIEYFEDSPLCSFVDNLVGCDDLLLLKFNNEDEIKNYVETFRLSKFDSDSKYRNLTYTFNPNETVYINFGYIDLYSMKDFVNTAPYPVTNIMSLEKALKFKIDFDKFYSEKFIKKFIKRFFDDIEKEN